MTTSNDTPMAPDSQRLANRALWTETIALFYESAGSFARRKDFIAAVSGLFGGEAAAFIVWGGGPPPLMRAALSELELQDLEAEYHDRTAAGSLFGQLQQADDFSVISGRLGQRPGAALTDRHWVAGVMENDATSRSAVLILRSTSAEPWGHETHEAMRELLQYFKRGLQHNRWFERYRHTAQAGTFLMDRAMRGILLFAPRGAITYRNAEARRIVDDGDGISQSDNGLEFTDAEADRNFSDFLAGASAVDKQATGDNLKLGQSLRVNRPSGRSPYQLVMYRLPTGLSEASFDQTLGVVACMIHDPERAIGLSGESIREFFKLTPAETNLAVALLREYRLPDAAESLGISVNTARTQLKSIFHKLGVNSQPAMMQRLTQTLELRDPSSPGDFTGPDGPGNPGADA